MCQNSDIILTDESRDEGMRSIPEDVLDKTRTGSASLAGTVWAVPYRIVAAKRS